MIQNKGVTMNTNCFSLLLLFTMAYGKKEPTSDIDGEGVTLENGDLD